MVVVHQFSDDESSLPDTVPYIPSDEEFDLDGELDAALLDGVVDQDQGVFFLYL